MLYRRLILSRVVKPSSAEGPVRTVIIFLSFAAIFSQSALSAERPTKVRIGVVSRSTLDMPYYVARDRGFFREEGLDPEIILIR